MSILTAASSKSVFKGYDYYTQKKVLSACQLDESRWAGQVSGSNGETYDVTIDIRHPRKGRCSCPFADGRQVVCKHMVALFFTAVPDEAEKYRQELEEQTALENTVFQMASNLAEIHSILHEVPRGALEEMLFAFFTTLSPEDQLEFKETLLGIAEEYGQLFEDEEEDDEDEEEGDGPPKWTTWIS